MLGLSDIIGQDEAVERLRRLLGGERRPHALLFAGPEGVGRRTTALALARGLLCPHADGDACGACEDCRMLDAESHPDLHIITKELAAYHPDPKVRERKMQNLGIDVVRHFLIGPAGQSPARGRGRVFIVLEAELLSEPAQNALLKTLEEPPPSVTILLICRRPDALLPTTLSRCALVRFRLLPKDFVARRLTKEGIEAAEAQFWAELTGGSLGRALGMSAQGLYEIKREMLSRVLAGDEADVGEYLANVMKKLAGRQAAEAKEEEGPELAALLAQRRAAGAMLELLASAYTDALHRSVGADLPVVHADQSEVVDELANRFAAETLAEMVEQLAEAERMLWRNVSPSLVWDNVAITCASGAPLRV